MAQLVTGTYGAGHWRTKETDRVPRFNQARRQKGKGGVTGGYIDHGTMPGKGKKGKKSVTIEKKGKRARKTHRKNVRKGGLGL